LVIYGIWQSYSDVTRFSYIQGIFYEALRMFPLVLQMPKESAYDTTLRTKNKNGETVVVPCPKGTQVNLCAIALHFNRELVPYQNNTGIEDRFTAKYWPNPEAFNPDRFLGDWNRDAYIPFSAGARSCIGRRYVIVHSYPERQSDNE
jgi:cytochrome P450